MRIERVPIDWRPELPIFAHESFLRSVGNDCGWLKGFTDSGEPRCLLPYTIIRKPFIRMIRFRVETIPLGENFEVAEERDFLNGAMKYFRSIGADMVIPGSNNAIFRAYPDGSDAAPYGSYVIDLSPPEETLWRNMDRVLRQNIKTAEKSGVTIRTGLEHLEAAHKLVSETFRRSKLPFMGLEAFRKYVHGLGDNGLFMLAEYQGVAQSYVLFAFSEYCAYAIYAGNVAPQHQGANKLLYWEAIRMFKGLGVRTYDFMGARIDPEKGSKQEALAHFKKRFGAELKRGFIWKFPIHALKYKLYGLAARVRSGGDIVDAERHKLRDYDDIRNQ
jgi:hypothetical protein